MARNTTTKNTELKKISFDGGKTFLDLSADNGDFSVIIQKLRKQKNWAIVVDAMEAEALMQIKYRGTATNAESRAQVLCDYLMVAKKDLVVKVS